MTINSLKELDKLIQLCRRRGVESIRVDGIEFHLGQEPTTQKRIRKTSANNQVNTAGDVSTIDTPDELTPEQLLMWSAGAGGVPEQIS